MNYRTRLTLAIASATALLAWTAVIIATPNATGATVTATYPGCDQTMPLNDWWPLKVDGGDIIRPTNRVATLAGWGPSNGVTWNGSSARGVGGMLYGPTNINIGARDFVIGATLKTNDTRYNGPIQAGNNPNAGGGGVGPGMPGFVKLTGVYATLVGELDTVKLSDRGIGDDPTQPTRAVAPTGDPYSDNHNTTNQTTYLCVQRIGGVLSYYVNGHLQESSTVDVGPINLTAAANPIQMLGKYQPGIGYDADDMCGVARISATDHDALLPTTLNCQEWNVQLGTRLAAAKSVVGSRIPHVLRGWNAGAKTTTLPFCQYDVYQGTLTVEKIGAENAGRYVSALVTNNAGTQSVALHGYLSADNGDAIWTHGVWPTYTAANVKAWVSGNRCQGV